MSRILQIETNWKVMQRGIRARKWNVIFRSTKGILRAILPAVLGNLIY